MDSVVMMAQLIAHSVASVRAHIRPHKIENFCLDHICFGFICFYLLYSANILMLLFIAQEAHTFIYVYIIAYNIETCMHNHNHIITHAEKYRKFDCLTANNNNSTTSDPFRCIPVCVCTYIVVCFCYFIPMILKIGAIRANKGHIKCVYEAKNSAK